MRRSMGLVLMVVACTSRPPELPAELAQVLAEKERLGASIYAQDQAAWRATDAARAAGLAKPPIQGWITVASAGGQLVRFVAPCGDAACSLVDVEVDAQGRTAVRETQLALPPDHAAIWSARKLAMESGFRACSPTYNTVVLQAERDGQPAWDVYLLAASGDANLIPLAGHHRITVSADGKAILEAKPLSRSCVTLDRRSAPEGARVAVAIITHVLDPHPIETHVFTSLSYATPVYVGTEAGNFAVENGKIRVIDLEPKPKAP